MEVLSISEGSVFPDYFELFIFLQMIVTFQNFFFYLTARLVIITLTLTTIYVPINRLLLANVTHIVQSDSSSTDYTISTDGSGVGWFLVECKY